MHNTFMTIKGIKWRIKLLFNNFFAMIKHPALFSIKIQGLLRLYEMSYIYDKALSTNIDTPILDVGSHLGLSSAVLSMLGRVYSFEWFRGLQNVELIDGSFKNNDYIADKNQFLNNTKNLPIKLFDGDAVQNIKDLNLKQFSFVYLDLDLYRPTKEILSILDAIARPGNIIVCHDAHSNGIARAFAEFHSSKLFTIETKWNFISIVYA